VEHDVELEEEDLELELHDDIEDKDPRVELEEQLLDKEHELFNDDEL